jgi:bacterioferritin-associated ferredoxin
MSENVKRICSLCGVDRTPLLDGIQPVHNRRGECLGLFGLCCYQAVLKAVDLTPRSYRNIKDTEIKKFVYEKARQIKEKQINQQHEFEYNCGCCGHFQTDFIESNDSNWQLDKQGFIDVECPDCGWRGGVPFKKVDS